MTERTTDIFKRGIGGRSKKNVEKLRQLMCRAGAVLPSGNPLTTHQIQDLPGQPFRTHSLTNHLSKKPEFERVGTIRVRNLDGTGTYPVSQWLASPEPISKTAADQRSVTKDIGTDTESTEA